MAKVITFGEIMLRLSPAGCERFVQAESFGATYGGGEANVAVSISNFGMDAAFVTKLPKHEIGQAAVNSLRRYGVDTSNIVRGGGRVGIYFLEKGASQRPSKVVYDRAGSSLAEASAEDFNWEKIFAGADWFHFTGITPALGGSAADICLAACKAAKSAGLTVSCDLNYRKNLWSCEEAGRVMTGLMEYVDVFIVNEEHANIIFGIKAEDTGGNTAVSENSQPGRLAPPVAANRNGPFSQEGCKSVARQLKERFGFKKVVVTLRESVSADDNNFAAMLYDGEGYYFSKKYAMHIVDRVGGGDSFGAGLIYAALKGMPPQNALEFAVAAGALKHSIEGDCNLVSADEVAALAEGDGSGRVQR